MQFKYNEHQICHICIILNPYKNKILMKVWYTHIDMALQSLFKHGENHEFYENPDYHNWRESPLCSIFVYF